jgi:osmoprotectant transport system ATP-binding protein
VPRGSVVSLIGPSGCGKTTTLRIINRLIEPTSGTIEIDGEDVTKRPVAELRRDIGYVIQQVGLFPHRTVSQNIATVPKTLGWDKARTRDRIHELSVLVGLDEHMLDRYPDELSGGQQQRVGVARALAADPPVLLMDEPFGAVDPIVRSRLQDELLDLQEKVHKTIVLVTHDLDEALKLSDRIALLNVGAIVEQYAEPDDLLRAPANEFVETFIGDDRGVKRLQLSTVSRMPYHQGPVVDVSAGVDEARAVCSTTTGSSAGSGATTSTVSPRWLMRPGPIPRVGWPPTARCATPWSSS